MERYIQKIIRESFFMDHLLNMFKKIFSYINNCYRKVFCHDSVINNEFYKFENLNNKSITLSFVVLDFSELLLDSIKQLKYLYLCTRIDQNSVFILI
jgi:hypothetical protein